MVAIFFVVTFVFGVSFIESVGRFFSVVALSFFIILDFFRAALFVGMIFLEAVLSIVFMTSLTADMAFVSWLSINVSAVLVNVFKRDLKWLFRCRFFSDVRIAFFADFVFAIMLSS